MNPPSFQVWWANGIWNAKTDDPYIGTIGGSVEIVAKFLEDHMQPYENAVKD